MSSFIGILLIFLASAILLMSRFALWRIKQPTTLILWLVKVFTSAVSPVLLLFSLLLLFTGLLLSSIPLDAIAGCSAALYAVHLFQSTRPPDRPWSLDNPPLHKFLEKRYMILLPRSPRAELEQDIPFYTVAGTGRSVLCDVWQPPRGTPRSGLAFIYLHGAAWAVLDKDVGTRTLFRRLAAQGHVIMDLANRLFPETDFMGMIHDTKQAIAWMKKNATRYRINPDRIVIGGGSSGAHIALLTAYTSSNELFTPAELLKSELGVHGVISLYGQSDLVATYYHTCQNLSSHSALGKKKEGRPAGMPSWIQKKMGKDLHRLGFDKDVQPGMLVPMLGGAPGEKPEAYAFFSPLSHVDENCPTTLIIHGRQDILAPVEAVRRLESKLKEAGIPVLTHYFSQADHAFDLILPKISPSAHNAIYDMERFLAVMAVKQESTPRVTLSRAIPS